MKKICVVTSTRADYGIFKPLLSKLSKDFELSIVATGMHLCPEFGNTYTEIEADGFTIDKKIGIQLSSDNKASMSKTMGLAMIAFADYFEEKQPDLLVVLGDRYEIAAVCSVAVNQGIPIAHLHGGDTTEGAVDECYRHSITKMSYLHFTSCEDYRKRVIQLGESPDRVFNYGALSIENIVNIKPLTLEELGASINFDLTKKTYCVVTFHPVTLENETGLDQLRELINTLDMFTDMNFIITKANSDAGGREINSYLEKYASEHENVVCVSSLGMKRYISALKYAQMMIGNSSSGIYEAPAVGIPTINIGDRQKGRIQANSIINCKAVCSDIVTAMRTALTEEFRDTAKNTVSIYGDGNTSEKIVLTIRDFLENGKIELKKKFFDIER